MVADVDLTGAVAGGADARAARAAPRLGLPCHTSEQLNQPPSSPSVVRGGKSQRLARLRVELEIQGMVARWGASRIGFLTFTFADDVQTIAEAQRRFNSLNSHALAGRYPEWVAVVQRHQDNRIHFHLVVVMAEDIRTGFDFDAVRRRDYSSASVYLKAEWKFLRDALPDYQFGRHELLPIKNPQGFGTYVARYVGRTLHTRGDEKGARLVRFSKGFRRCVCGPFSKVDLIEKRARDRQPAIVAALGYQSQDALESDLGPAWRYHLARLRYCDQWTFSNVLTAIERSLEFYGGRSFVIADEFRLVDARRLEAERRPDLFRVLREADALDRRQAWGFRLALKGSPQDEGVGVQVTTCPGVGGVRTLDSCSEGA